MGSAISTIRRPSGVCIDADMFPHIMDAVVAYAAEQYDKDGEAGGLLALRATSTEYRDKVNQILHRKLVVRPLEEGARTRKLLGVNASATWSGSAAAVYSPPVGLVMPPAWQSGDNGQRRRRAHHCGLPRAERERRLESARVVALTGGSGARVGEALDVDAGAFKAVSTLHIYPGPGGYPETTPTTSANTTVVICPDPALPSAENHKQTTRSAIHMPMGTSKIVLHAVVDDARSARPVLCTRPLLRTRTLREVVVVLSDTFNGAARPPRIAALARTRSLPLAVPRARSASSSSSVTTRSSLASAGAVDRAILAEFAAYILTREPQATLTLVGLDSVDASMLGLSSVVVESESEDESAAQFTRSSPALAHLLRLVRVEVAALLAKQGASPWSAVITTPEHRREAHKVVQRVRCVTWERYAAGVERGALSDERPFCR
ncbi:uncharacterized protein LOC62_03G005173 [Vanrija pseudolonga]|uniref:Uncharacterized protein n=1 Tax=Vanrija pseudolonga TaxID=143232 RepID=A0AAF0Y7S3_9TREE|nr:hypothetical protein LOC62_03G005173 [Vanrija pseudolonga]